MKSYLPPLPELPDAVHYLPPGESMPAVLGTEHRFLDAMCADVRDVPSRDQANVLVAVLCRHLSAERQYLYPTAAKALPDGAGIAVAEERLHADRVLLADAEVLLRSELDSSAWRAALAAVRGGVQEHQRDCEERLFAPLSATISEADLIRLGNRVDMALEAAPSRPHPGAPQHAPWNKLTDALLGTADKVRDLATGRSTYPMPPQVAARKRLRTRNIPITQY